MCFHLSFFNNLIPEILDHLRAKVSRALRILTQSLFPSFQLAVFPLPGASWTATRLLAGEDVGGCCQGWMVKLPLESKHSKGEGPLMYDPVWSFEASCIKLSCLGLDGQDSIFSTSMHLAMPLNPSNCRGLLPKIMWTARESSTCSLSWRTSPWS